MLRKDRSPVQKAKSFTPGATAAGRCSQCHAAAAATPPGAGRGSCPHRPAEQKSRAPTFLCKGSGPNRPKRVFLTGCGTKRHSTYRFGTVVIAYPWHPLHGRQLPVVRRRGRRGTEVIDVEVRPGVSRELPAWMSDQAACAAMSVGPAQVSVAALNELRAVLTQRSTPASLLESSEGKRKETSDETITQAGKRAVHSGPSPRAKPTSRRSEEGGTAQSAGGSDAGGTRRRINREPRRKGGKR